jgi:hypothetical protein
MSERHSLNDDRHDLVHPDGSRTIVWVRRGRVRLAVIGSAAVLAAGGAAYATPGDDQAGPPAADQTSVSR